MNCLHLVSSSHRDISYYEFFPFVSERTNKKKMIRLLPLSQVHIQVYIEA